MESLNRQQRRQAERNSKKLKEEFKLPKDFEMQNTYPQNTEYSSVNYLQIMQKPLIQFWTQFRTIEINFGKKNQNDFQFIHQILGPNSFIAEESPKIWNLKFFEGLTTEKVLNQLSSRFEFVTLATCASKLSEDKIIASYFAKDNISKRMEKQCYVCRAKQNLRFNLCCGSTICWDCEPVIKKKQCSLCKFSWISMNVKGEFTVQLRSRLPGWHINPVQIYN